MVILEVLKAIIDNFGSAIIVPVIITVIALIFKVKPGKAILSGLYAGVSLQGFSLLIGAYTPIITPLVQNMSGVMSNITGVHLNTFDVGWQATSVVAFATSAGMIYLGLGIALQTALFLLKWTNIFQPSDLWNNYSYIVWGAMVIFATHNFILGIACMVVLNLYSLLISELVAKRWSKYYGYPNCTIIAMHNVEPALFAIIIDPIFNLLGLNKVKLNPKTLEKKLGFLGEPMALGFFLGAFIGILGSLDNLGGLAGWGDVLEAGTIWFSLGLLMCTATAPLFTEVARGAGFAIPAGAAMITSFNILGKPLLGLVFLAFLSGNPIFIAITVVIYGAAYAVFKIKNQEIVAYLDRMADKNV